MKSLYIIICLFFTTSSFCFAIDRKDFYPIFSFGNLTQVNQCIETFKKAKPSSINNVYIGAMLIKKADLEFFPTDKLEYFKAGYTMLEKEIKAHPENIEYRFIRLTIQETAPSILGYNQNIQEDKKLVVQNFYKLDTSLQFYIKEYCKQSKILTLKDLG